MQHNRNYGVVDKDCEFGFLEWVQIKDRVVFSLSIPHNNLQAYVQCYPKLFNIIKVLSVI